jgi:Staphylococcal nuclease homologue
MGRTLAFAVLCWTLALVAGERCLAIDGDTLVCNHQKVRLTNVYAAELNQAGGYAAKRRLQLIVSSGEAVLRPYGRDHYGRTLAEIYVNGRRIEQADIGPRAGRGAEWHGDRHHYLPRHSKRPIALPRGPKSCLVEKDSGRFV